MGFKPVLKFQFSFYIVSVVLSLDILYTKTCNKIFVLRVGKVTIFAAKMVTFSACNTYTKLANITGLYFLYFTTFRDQSLQFCYDVLLVYHAKFTSIFDRATWTRVFNKQEIEFTHVKYHIMPYHTSRRISSQQEYARFRF